MKKILQTTMCILLPLLSHKSVNAQGTPSFAGTTLIASSAPQCTIRFAYDKAGNRIKREYYCESVLPFDPAGGGGVSGTVSVYPNPTSGTFNVYLSILQFASITVSNMNGQSVAYAQSPGAEKITFDLSGQLPGNYIIKVMQRNSNQQFQITKL